jgi:hypothetical protein
MNGAPWADGGPWGPHRGVVHAWVGQIVTFFAYRPNIVPLAAPRAPYLTPTQPGRVTNPTRRATLGRPGKPLRQSAGRAQT